MTPEERTAAKKIARIMRAARKELGLNQESVSSQLGISQSALSKLEHGTLIPSAPQWFSFCRLTGISTQSFITGYIERNHPAVVSDASRVGTFKLPRRYALYRGSKVRAVLPFLNYLRACIGEKKLFEFLKARKVDPDYLIDLDNMISLQFTLDIVKYLIEEKFLRPTDVAKLTKPVAQPDYHGSLYSRYIASQGPAAMITSLVLNARHYECNFSYRIEDQKKNYLVFSVEPEKHLADIEYRTDPVLGDFLCRYKRSYFERFVQTAEFEGEKAPEVRELECHYHGAERCIYRLDFNGA